MLQLKANSCTIKAHLLMLPCIPTNTYNGDTSDTIVFRIQHNPNGRYIDAQATRFKCTLQFTFPNSVTASDAFF